jgi:acyl dehydratase/NAD(P)-dependent dehydrogenase (short-subunit alcohol dehydrogenase family)
MSLPPSAQLASRIFDSRDQTHFAALTRDYNPVHLDALVARRTQAGAPIVHGIHVLLWLLDAVAARYPQIDGLTALNVRFQQMIYVGHRVEAEVRRLTADTLRARVSTDGVEAIAVSAMLGTGRFSSTRAEPAKLIIPPTTARELSLKDIDRQAGRIGFTCQAAKVASRFPHAARLLGSSRLAALGSSSFLVGMIVPGLHSVYGGLEVRFTTVADGDAVDELRFSVTSVDQRFRRVLLAVEGGGLEGLVEAYWRAPPVAQPSMQAVAPLVASDEFRDAIALVVGGSRGLGEITAKLLAAGGARVVVTYATGKDDADRLAREITDWGGRCELMVYDARQEAYAQLQRVKTPPTHLYYFATPLIVRPKPDIFVRERFDEFNQFYLDGFLHLVDASLRLHPGGIAAFYPSTVAIEDRPAKMTEYAMSKAAGEVLCADIARYRNGVRIVTERLPRVATDQTASLVEVETRDALSVMLPIVRQMHQSAPPARDAPAKRLG